MATFVIAIVADKRKEALDRLLHEGLAFSSVNEIEVPEKSRKDTRKILRRLYDEGILAGFYVKGERR